VVAAALFLTMVGVAFPSEDDGQPFGRMTEKDFAAFEKFASAHSLDVETEMKKVYSGDSAALAAVLRFSTVFDRLDSQARAYGNLLYATFLNVVEKRGDEVFVSALAVLSESERQRARDFFYYPVRKVPKKHRSDVERETRERFPRLFPLGYQFGKNDALFN
jgi:hypothetical protein